MKKNSNSHNQSQRYFIVGASGYIGKALFDACSKYTCVFGTTSMKSSGFFHLDLNSPSYFNFELIQPSDVFFLTAAISSPDICSKEYDRAWKVNVTGTSEFINKTMARGAKVIFFSSDTVYGEKIDTFDESANCVPAGEYAEMKYEVEKKFLNNPLFKSIRLSYVFSQKDKFTKYLLDCATFNWESEVFHPFYRAVIHRNDVVQGVISLAQNWDEFPQSVINFGGNDVLSRIEFAEVLKTLVIPNLQFRITEPVRTFFTNRPRFIQMRSPILTQLLGRTPHTLQESVKIEFNIFDKIKKKND